MNDKKYFVVPIDETLNSQINSIIDSEDESNERQTNGWPQHIINAFTLRSREEWIGAEAHTEAPIKHRSSDPIPIANSKQMRPILKNSHQSQQDWYKTYAVETGRHKGLNEKHVRFANDPSLTSSLPSNGIHSKPTEELANKTIGSFRMTSNSISFEECLKENYAMEYNYRCNQLQSNSQNFGNLTSLFFNDPIWSNDSNTDHNLITSTQITDSLNQIYQMKNTAKRQEASYTWSGQLPRRVRTKNPIYSCKVFLGGIPYDLTDSDLHCTFAQFGHIQIQWPGKDIKSAIDGAAANKAGYVYIIFEAYDNVAALLNSCTISYRDLDTGCRWYYNISSRRQKGKEVQVIPFDIGDRFHMKNSFSGQMEHSRTVFVGALHGMLTADGLAKVMDDLFGGVIFAGLDTDKHKYPLGSGRVSFDNQESYLKAVLAAFVEIKSSRFKKKIQIDPYIENESICAVCKQHQQSPIFCREDFRYFCEKCWTLHHSDAKFATHRPIVKNKPNT